jgi:hypothetical protein
VFDIVYESEKRARFIEVKGMHNEQPVDFRIFGRVRKHNDWLEAVPLNSDKYFVYVVYNIRLNESPHLVILDSAFIKDYGHWRPEGRCIHVHDVHDVRKGIEQRRLKSHKLPRLATRTKKAIPTSVERLKKETIW